MVTAEYEELYPGDVEAVHIVYKTGPLDPLVQEYASSVRDLEDLIDDYASQKARGKTVKRQEVVLILRLALRCRCHSWQAGSSGK